MPWGASVSPDGRWIYVTHVGYKDHDNVHRHDAGTLAVLARAQFAGHAVESIPSADGKRLYVSNSRQDELLVLDAESLEVLARHRTGRLPKDFRLSPDEQRAYVADHYGGTLSVIDLAGGTTQRVKLGKHPRGVALTRDGATVYVTNLGSGTLSVIDTATLTVTRTVAVCRGPRHVAVVGDGGLVLVTCLGARHLVVLDGPSGEIVRKLEVGAGPKTVALTHDQKLAITADERGDSITLVDLQSWTTLRLPLPADKPCGVAVAPDDRRVYVTARGSHELLAIERVPLE